MKILLFTLFFTLVACNKSNNKADTDNKIINELVSSWSVDSELWKIKLIEKELVQTNHKVSEDLKCNQYNVIFTINLQKDCFQSKGLFDRNLITAEIKKMLIEEDAFELGSCYTQSDVDANIEKWKKDQSKLVGSTVCQSYKNLIFGGGCDKEIVMTQEMVDEDAEIVKQKAQASLRGQAHLKKGHSFLKRSKIEVCEDPSGKMTAIVLKE